VAAVTAAGFLCDFFTLFVFVLVVGAGVFVSAIAAPVNNIAAAISVVIVFIVSSPQLISSGRRFCSLPSCFLRRFES
jgi:hypothetical protein